jgi:HSP20 family molecular chaperone IbpA
MRVFSSGKSGEMAVGGQSAFIQKQTRFFTMNHDGRRKWLAALLLIALLQMPGIYSALVSISDVNPPRSILNGLESLVDIDTLDDLRILRHSTTNAHIAPESYEHANDFYDGPICLKRILQPQFKVHSTKCGFILTAATPGLRKDDMSIEIVNGSDGPLLDIKGGHRLNTTSSETGSTFPYILGGWQNCWSRDFPITTAPLLRLPRREQKYAEFKKSIPIPKYYNISSLLARYEDGLLVVTTAPLANDFGQRAAAV